VPGVWAGEGGAGIAFGGVSLLVELGESGVVGEDWLVGGLEGEEADECANGKVASAGLGGQWLGCGRRFALRTNAHSSHETKAR
jgi:hypothetical protein